MIRNDKELIVVGDRVLVQVRDGDERTKVGLYLPSTAADSQAVQGGTIMATGPGMPMPSVQRAPAWHRGAGGGWPSSACR